MFFPVIEFFFTLDKIHTVDLFDTFLLIVQINKLLLKLFLKNKFKLKKRSRKFYISYLCMG